MDKLTEIPGVSDRDLSFLCQQALSAVESPFKEAPVDILTFADAFEFRRYPPAVKRLQVFESKLRDEPDYRYVTEFVESDGKGSGKDFRASIKAAYALYWMQCLGNPHAYYNLAADEPIDVVIVAETYSQARNVTYAKLVERLQKLRGALWVGKPAESQSYDQASKPVPFSWFNMGRFDFLHAGMQVRLPHNVTLHVMHGDVQLAEGAEQDVSLAKSPFDGMNVLVSLFTEPSAIRFNKARAIATMLESSGKTRFGRRYSAHYMSYVRDALKFDFIASKYADSQKPKNKGTMVGFRGKSWEVNEAIRRDPVTGEEDMVRIECPEHGPKLVPRVLAKDYQEDPVGAAAKYEGVPPRAARGLFPYPWMIDECGAEIESPVRFEPFISERVDRLGELRQYTALSVVWPLLNIDWFVDPESMDFQLRRLRPIDHRPRIFALDPGKTHGHYALAGGFPDILEAELQVEHNLLCRPKIDILTEWIPSSQYPVDFVNVRIILDILIRLFPNTQKFVFDSWNSQSDIDHLIAQGVPAHNYHFSRSQQQALYQNCVMFINNNLVQYPLGTLPNDLKNLFRHGSCIESHTDRKHLPDAFAMALFELRSMRPVEVTGQPLAVAAVELEKWVLGQ